MNRRKVNTWRDPAPKPEGYLSPHCTSGTCKWCSERRARAARARTAALEAATAPRMFWDRQIDRGQEQLGPSAPDAWKQTYVGRDPRDVLGYWS